MIKARYDGPGEMVDHHDATSTNDPIPHGGVFETTKKRLGELHAQGFAVTELSKADAAKADAAGEGVAS